MRRLIVIAAAAAGIVGVVSYIAGWWVGWHAGARDEAGLTG